MTDFMPPSYDELPAAAAGGRSGWNGYGPGSALGSISLQTPERIAAAAREVRRGAVFALDAPLDAFGHEHWGRRLTRREIVHPDGAVFFDDLLQDFGLQNASQWDSLAHVGYRPDEFYGGATEAEVLAGTRNTIDLWSARGIAGRGVLLDLVRTMADLGRPYDPSGSIEFGVEVLDAAVERAGVSIEPGDILLLHTGFAEYFASLTVAERTERDLVSPGLAHDESVARWLWDRHPSAIASDNLAIEAWPNNFDADAFPWGAMHTVLIGQLGLALGELWSLDALAADCAEDGRSTVFIASAPLHVRGGYGSPANALAFK